MEIQQSIGADIIMAFDECSPYPCDYKQAKQAISPWMVALLILGSPLWVSLLAAVFAIGVSLFVSLWSVIISLWATEVALWGSALGGLVLGIIQICTGSGWAGIGYIGIALVCAGTSLLLFYGCKATTKGAVLLTKTVTVKITNCIRKKEGNK